MTLETAAIAFAHEFQKAYIEERNLERVFTMLHPAVQWNGIAGTGFCDGMDQTASALKEQAARYQGTYAVLGCDYHASAVSEDCCLITGWARVREKEENPFRAEFLLRISLLCRFSGEIGKLLQAHLSLDGLPEENRDCFSAPIDRETRRRLKKLMEEKSAEIEARNRDLHTLTKNVPGGIFRCRFDDRLTLLQMSEGFLSMLGYTREEIRERFGDSFWEMILPEDRERSLADANRQLEKGDDKELEYRITCKDGDWIWVLDKGQRILEEDGTQSFYCILVDVTRARKAQEELNLSLERHRIILDQTNDIIFEWDMKKDTLVFSSNWQKKFGYPPITTDVRKRIPQYAHVYTPDRRELGRIMAEIISGQKSYVEAEVRFQQADKYIWCRIRATAQYDKQGKPIKAVGVVVDIDNEKKQSQKLLEKAERDTLTKLYNKGTAQSLIEEHLNRAGPVGCDALLVIDVDNFKQVNDTKGHLFGDAFLVEVADAICGLFRGIDIVGRIGGDEFIVCIKDVPDPHMAVHKAGQVVDAFRSLAANTQNAGHVSCSVGIAVSPMHGTAFQDLYRKADHALYRAKKQGKNQCVLYDETCDEGYAFGSFTQAHTAINETIDSNDVSVPLNSKLVEYVFRILYQSMDIESAVNSILEIVGRQFDVSRAYIFENNEDGQYFSNTFEWCNDGVVPEKQNLQNISSEKGMDGDYFTNFDENAIFYCRDISVLPARLYNILAPQGIKSLLQCTIRDGGAIKGYVGFDECRVNRFWTQEQVNVLVFISEILSTFLLKKRAQDRALQSAQDLHTMLDNQDSWIYVIDPESFEMKYINRKTREMVPLAQIGMHCYESFFHRTKPCDPCPASLLRQGRSSCLMEVYNPMLDVWTSADASRISWKGKGAILLTCHDITKYKRGAE